GFRNRDFRGRYGYYWWVNGVMADGKRPWPSAPPQTYMSHGNGGNFCCVVPEWDLVLVRMGRPSISDRLWEAFFARLADGISSDGDSKADATKPVTLADGAAAARRIGDWQIARWPGLAVVADPHGDVIHLVYGDDQRLYYTRGTDSGQSWSKPDMIVQSGMHPRLALDSARTLHLAYCTPRVRFPGDRIPKEGCYLTLRDGKWSSPIKVSQPDQGAVDVRIVVDGDDNVHVIYWSLGTPSGELGEHDNHRCYYRRKPAGSSDFEEALCFENSVATGPSSHGALAVGPRGEVHVLYRTFRTSPAWTGNLEYRVREKDGTWRGEPEVFRGVYLADHSLSAAVDVQGTLHVAGYTFRPGGFKFQCYRKEPNGRLQVAFVEDDTYGTSTDIVPTPSGDLWLAGSGNWSTRSRTGTPRSRYYHYDAARRQWTEEFLSPEGSINVDTFCLGPRLLRYDDQIRVFYAQKEADQHFRLYQRVLAHAGWDEVAPKRLHRTVDLSLGESQAMELSDGKTATVKLLDLEETRDEMPCSAVREACVKVEVNGQPITLTSATYHLPVTVAGVQIDCPITKGYVQNARTNRWGLDKDARLRLWPAGSPWIVPGTFVYPARQRWFASDTQMANEPVFVNGDEKPENSSIYYHWGLDIGGCEGMVAVVSATDGVVVSDGKNVLAGHEDVPGIAPTYDEVNILDARGWYYCYCHLQSIDPAVRLGQTVRVGQKIGTLGKEGSSGGWSHLHFHITARQPSGKWGIEEGYAFLWQAYRIEHAPGLLAVARPHHFAAIGQKVTLDGTRSWSTADNITSYEWTFTDGKTASGARVERTYDRPGTYSEMLKIADDLGRVDYDFAVVQVVDAVDPKSLPPTIHTTYAPTFGIRPGAPVTFKVRTFRTTAGEERWDFGDGSPAVQVRSDGNVKPRAIDGYAETVHRYTQPGHYVVRVERSAKDGSKAIAHLQVRVIAP
ncbi:MAG: PKD domain-containing protein, partial [Phycisphaerae bacterium]|nr:PKD domain-containing protein [Phycisphaerae bacterium]